MDIYNLFCPWEPAKFLIFSDNVPYLLFYSHIPAIVVSLMLGLLIFFGNKKSVIGKLLLSVAFAFSVWSFFDLILWATNRTDVTIFFWSLQIMFEVFVFILSFYLVYVYIKNKFPSFKLNLIIFILTVPFIALIPTKLNLMGVDLSNCYALENGVIIYYSYILEILMTLSSIVIIILGFKEDINRRKEILVFFVGISLFLFAFSFGNMIGSFTSDWVVAQYGLFGMPVFIGFLAYLIVRFHAFNIKLIATQALVWGLAILIGSQFFFIKVPINYLLTGVTFVASVIFGYFLIKSVKKEVEQREELAKLNINLQELLKQRESLVHLVTHKVKGSFTRSKYIFAGILDGTFGDVNEEVKKRAQQGLDSDNMGIETVDLVLNAANLEKGTVKYDMKNVNFKELVESSISDKKIAIDAKGLKLETEIKDDTYNVLGDALWLKEVANNLIENALKYTREGKITVGLSKKDRKILFYVKDTGIGISEDDKKNLFTEGGRGKESVKVNVDSTGYGLYSVRLIVDAHKGKVWMEPNKQTNGSVFFVELDAV